MWKRGRGKEKIKSWGRKKGKEMVPKIEQVRKNYKSIGKYKFLKKQEMDNP